MQAGIRHMIFVTGRSKRAIEDHFDTAYELEAELEASHKHELLKLVRSMSPPDMVCSYVRQPRSLGLGHAVLCAAPLVGDEPFAVLLADDLMTGPWRAKDGVAQMVTRFWHTADTLLAVQEVPVEHVNRYGIVAGDASDEAPAACDRHGGKAQPEQAPSRLGVAGGTS
jgi:UTP--glucose-1-phosphate uridylyltransferase